MPADLFGALVTAAVPAAFALFFLFYRPFKKLDQITRWSMDKAAGWVMVVVAAVQGTIAVLYLPTSPKIGVEGRTLRSPPLGLTLELPSTWQILPTVSGVDFVARHDDTGAVLSGHALKANPRNETLDATLAKAIASQKDAWVSATVSDPTDTMLGELPARSVRATVTIAHGTAVVAMTVAVKLPYKVGIYCAAPQGVAAAFAACEQALSNLVLPAR